MNPQSRQYKDTLLNNIVPFWERHSLDLENGGYFTCLDREGKVYDTDKFMWLQGRQAWMFSTFYNKVEQKENWLKIAKIGVDFIRDKGMDAQGNVYFSLTADGQPLVQPYNIFSDCFAAMAFAQYGLAAHDQKYKELAKKMYLNILKKKDSPKGIYEKETSARPLKSFALPMILSNMVLELEDILEPSEVERTIDFSIQEVMEVFLDKKSSIIYEFVKLDGSLEDSFNGRLLNPGHGIEAMWFMIDIAVRRNEQEVLLNLKGGKWKGCFHVPRAMLQCWKTFERMENTGIIK